MIHQLTERELEIARLLGQNYTQGEIATRIGLSQRTVKAYTAQMRLKLGVERTRHIPGVLKKLGIIP